MKSLTIFEHASITSVRVVVPEDLGELDKSGIAELMLKDRHKNSGDRV